MESYEYQPSDSQVFLSFHALELRINGVGIVRGEGSEQE